MLMVNLRNSIHNRKALCNPYKFLLNVKTSFYTSYFIDKISEQKCLYTQMFVNTNNKKFVTGKNLHKNDSYNQLADILSFAQENLLIYWRCKIPVRIKQLLLHDYCHNSKNKNL